MPDLIELTIELPQALTLCLLEPPAELPADIAHVMIGPRGPQGVPGPTGGATLVPVGPWPLSGHSAVALDGAGQLVPADCTLPDHLGAVLGVVANAYLPGDSAEVKTEFPLEHEGWTWTVGPVYVGAAGQLTQILPPGALYCQVIGYALSATRVLINPQPAILIA